MRKKIHPILIIGLFIFVAVTIIQRFITPITDWIAILLLLIAINLILFGGFKMK